jgi:hypothetical protein
LDVGVFPDRETVKAAVTQLAAGNEVRHRSAPAAEDGDSEWNQVLAEVLAADLVVTL